MLKVKSLGDASLAITRGGMVQDGGAVKTGEEEAPAVMGVEAAKVVGLPHQNPMSLASFCLSSSWQVHHCLVVEVPSSLPKL